MTLSPLSQRTLNHTSGDPVALISNQKPPKIPLTQLHFPQHDSGQWKSSDSCQNSYQYPPHIMSPSYPPQETLDHSSGDPRAPIRVHKQPKIPFTQLHFPWHRSVSLTMQIWQNCDLLEVKILPPVGPKVSLVDVLWDLARDMRVLTTFSGQSDV